MRGCANRDGATPHAVVNLRANAGPRGVSLARQLAAGEVRKLRKKKKTAISPPLSRRVIKAKGAEGDGSNERLLRKEDVTHTRVQARASMSRMS